MRRQLAIPVVFFDRYDRTPRLEQHSHFPHLIGLAPSALVSTAKHHRQGWSIAAPLSRKSVQRSSPQS
jgi:hypothetical protein